jgi:hypothetical protein
MGTHKGNLKWRILQDVESLRRENVRWQENVKW